MNEKTRKIAVFGVLIAVSIWGYANISDRMLSKGRPEIAAPAEGDNGSAADPGSYDAGRPAAVILPDSVFNAYETLGVKDDLFYHNYKKKQIVQSVNLRLLGILYRTANAQALINGKIVKVGDVVEGYEVAEITTDYVALTKNGKTIKLNPSKESS